ncbi:MAG: hypothetical protein ACR2NN_07320 [Bryobacteraceae bacterium]
MIRILFGVLIVLAACSAPKRPGIADLAGHEDLSFFKLDSLRGTRDGDRLYAQAVFTDSSSILTMEMRFEVGSPTRLQTGAWRWTRNNALTNGTISGRAITFLGGQSGPPSIGGTFDLLDQDAAAHYRVTIPVTELKLRLMDKKTWDTL